MLREAQPEQLLYASTGFLGALASNFGVAVVVFEGFVSREKPRKRVLLTRHLAWDIQNLKGGNSVVIVLTLFIKQHVRRFTEAPSVYRLAHLDCLRPKDSLVKIILLAPQVQEFFGRKLLNRRTTPLVHPFWSLTKRIHGFS
jgi:hypothetical protein